MVRCRKSIDISMEEGWRLEQRVCSLHTAGSIPMYMQSPQAIINAVITSYQKLLVVIRCFPFAAVTFSEI